MPPIDDLRRWFERDIRFTTWRQVDTLVQQANAVEIQFSTKFHVYTITADERLGQSFLGCTCFDRMRRTTRYFPEGYFDEDVWHDIVEAIEDNEMIRPAPRGHLF